MDLDTWKLFWIIHLAPKSITSVLIREKQMSFDTSTQKWGLYEDRGIDRNDTGLLADARN